MGRVGWALTLHELSERARDRWVLVIAGLFGLLASAVALYGQDVKGGAAELTGPSLVTLSSLFVPLVALVLSHDALVGERERNTLGLLFSLPAHRLEVVLAKFVGRAAALTLAIVLGLGAAIALAGEGEAHTLSQLLPPTLLLGLSFLAIGMLISAVTTRQVTAASLVVVVWFLMVFFYDLGLLGALVVTDGGLSQNVITALVAGNPAGLYRLQMMTALAGPTVFESMGMNTALPLKWAATAVWSVWILGPVLLSGLLLWRRKVMQ